MAPPNKANKRLKKGENENNGQKRQKIALFESFKNQIHIEKKKIPDVAIFDRLANKGEFCGGFFDISKEQI